MNKSHDETIYNYIIKFVLKEDMRSRLTRSSYYLTRTLSGCILNVKFIFLFPREKWHSGRGGRNEDFI